MKQLFTAAIIALSLVACNDNKTDKTTVTNDSTTTVNTTDVATVAYMENDYILKDNKVVVYKNGEWIAVTAPVTLANGTVIMPNGEIKNKDGVTVTLADGQKINNDGVVVLANGDNIFDGAAGGVKKGLNEAGDAIKTGAEKTGDAVKKGVQKTGDAIKSGANEVKKAVQ